MPGESTYWLPPCAVQASTNTTIAGGASPPANTASAVSGNGCRYGIRFRQIPTCPVKPVITYTLG